MEFFGWAATLVVSLQFIPQLVKSFKTKNTKDISLFMIFLIILGNTLWITHGILISDMPLIVTNVSVLLITLCLLFIKLKYK